MSTQRSDAASPPPRILVVDDIADNSFLLKVVLEEEGYLVDIADSGYAALAKIEAEPPDLVMLDVMMPGMSGYEVIQRLRQNSRLPFIPILLVTGHEKAAPIDTLSREADGFIRKPIDFNLMLEQVREILLAQHSKRPSNQYQTHQSVELSALQISQSR